MSESTVGKILSIYANVIKSGSTPERLMGTGDAWFVGHSGESMIDTHSDTSKSTAIIKATGGTVRAVCVHGVKGSGKTALLSELNDILLKRGDNVYFYISGRVVGLTPAAHTKSTEMAEPAGDEAIRELLRQLIRLYGDRFDKSFSDFVMSYAKQTLPANANGDTDLPAYDKDSFVKFIYDCVKTEPIVMIIDDLDKADAFTIRLIGNLIKINALSFLIFSHTDKLESDVLTEELYKNTRHIKYVQLSGIDTNETAISDDGSPISDSAADGANLPDEAYLVLNKPGNERALIHHHMRMARDFMRRLAYEKAIMSLNDALEVCKLLSSSIDDARLHINVLTKLGDAQTLDKQYEHAIASYSQAHSMCLISDKDFLTHKVSLSLSLADCCGKLGLKDREREYIMLAEAFFCTANRRTRFYELYARHIPKYLYLLSELGERAIFREKLKQAHSAWRHGDKVLAAALFCEDGLMCIESEDFMQARNLLFEARKIADDLQLFKIWDQATTSLAICAGQMNKPELSTILLNELITSSFDPAVIAGAMVNLALINFQLDGDSDKAADSIEDGIELCILSRDEKMMNEIRSYLNDTPFLPKF